MGSMVERAQIIVKGVVQGVGFRPFVYKLATSLRLTGYVTNTSEGVLIEGEGGAIPEFVRRLRTEAPPLSDITDISITSLPLKGDADFTIRASSDHAVGQPFTLVSPDVSICDDCLHELLDPKDRRYLYPFINCTNCGPRYSITTSVPYDRPNTTMAGFTLCPDCLREYQDPLNRRFHAQPNACPVCGPRVEFRLRNAECGVSPHPDPLPEGAREIKEIPLPSGERIKERGNDAISECIKLLQQGGIVAIKGLGGFHIACDAANDAAVQRLRENKRKSNKPFAVMSLSIEDIGQFCAVSTEEKNLLRSNRRSVVLLQKKTGEHLSEGVSPNNRYVGVMLPYTPLHHLLFTHPIGAGSATNHSHFKALVMTSGNLSEEPIVRDNDEALKKLSGMVDGFLLHDRDIFMRVDDSVLRIADCGLRIADLEQTPNEVSSVLKNSAIRNGHRPRCPQSAMSFIRRSRGYAPGPIALRDSGPEVLGVGADLKNTFTLTKGTFAIPSQHIGDMETVASEKALLCSIKDTLAFRDKKPEAVVCDLHPNYASAKMAEVFAEEYQIPLYRVQHHKAHILSAMAENGIVGEHALGVAWDGTGYGEDGTIWGGEFFRADENGLRRYAHFRTFGLIGGDIVAREPKRSAVAILYEIFGKEIFTSERFSSVTALSENERKLFPKMLENKVNVFTTSSAGRLFDAVASMLDMCHSSDYEGHAPILLEQAIGKTITDERYPICFAREKDGYIFDWEPMILTILDDCKARISRSIISAKFHNTLAYVIVFAVKWSGEKKVVLSGGCFQNKYLLERTIHELEKETDILVFTQSKVPMNDGGISLGQITAVIQEINKRPAVAKAVAGED